MIVFESMNRPEFRFIGLARSLDFRGRHYLAFWRPGW